MTLHSAHLATAAHSSSGRVHMYEYARMRAMYAILVCNTKWHKIKINFPMLVSFKLSLSLSMCVCRTPTLKFSTVSFVYSFIHPFIHSLAQSPMPSFCPFGSYALKSLPPVFLSFILRPILPFSHSIHLLHTI